MSEVTVASTSELPEVAAFYATCGYGGGINQADTVLVSRICGQLVGVVRLCPQEGVVVLRGMQVHPAFRRQGVALASCPHASRFSMLAAPSASRTRTSCRSTVVQASASSSQVSCQRFSPLGCLHTWRVASKFSPCAE